jgi:transcriptional regulator with XRE-family HTH domain
LTNYHYHDNDKFVKNKKPSKLRELRKAQNLTLHELARKARVSYTTVWNLENGPEEKVRSDTKYRVAEVLGVDPETLFPSEARLQRYYRFDCLFDFCPTLEFKNEIDVMNILDKLTREEVLRVYKIDSTPQWVINRLNREAKRLGLKEVELKK